jgi:hypothetical protein
MEKDFAEAIKLFCDRNFDKTWNCVIGVNFGVCISYQECLYVHFGSK